MHWATFTAITYEGTLLSTYEDPAGNKTRYEYDAAGNRVCAIYADGSTLEQEYDKVGQAVKV